MPTVRATPRSRRARTQRDTRECAWRRPVASGAFGWRPGSGTLAGLGLALCLHAVALTGCGQPNPKIIDASEPAHEAPVRAEPSPEAEKIRALVAAVRRSELTFVQDEIERTGTAAADKLQLLLDRDVDGVRNVEEFILDIAAPDREGDQDVVITGPEQTMLAREWFHRQLAQIDGVPYEPPPAVVAAERAQAERSGKRLRILDALMIVEKSESTFVVPSRRAAPTPTPKAEKKKLFKKRSPKAREYNGNDFAAMLRKKWEFLGADIDDLEPFITEIASDSFASLEPYRVRHPDGTTEQFETWLRGQLDDTARQIAQGG